MTDGREEVVTLSIPRAALQSRADVHIQIATEGSAQERPARRYRHVAHERNGGCEAFEGRSSIRGRGCAICSRFRAQRYQVDIRQPVVRTQVAGA